MSDPIEARRLIEWHRAEIRRIKREMGWGGEGRLRRGEGEPTISSKVLDLMADGKERTISEIWARLRGNYSSLNGVVQQLKRKGMLTWHNRKVQIARGRVVRDGDI